MSHKQTYKAISIASENTYTRLGDYVMLVKLRLSLLVVFTSILGYLIAAGGNVNILKLFILALGGFLVTSAANALNQVLERDYDKLMTRTADRPVTAGRMSASEAVMFAGISCLLGISLLALFNPITALLGTLSLIAYAFVYTPLKRYSTLAVAVGAIPGALPVMIGCTAFEGHISTLALVLFAIQFLWQFPHFWSIGFLAFEDYHKAGYKLLPSKNGQIDRSLGLHSLLYAALIIPIALIPFIGGSVSAFPTILVVLLSMIYAALCINFHMKFTRKAAMKLMFGSFFYLPFVLLAYWIF